KLVYFASPDAPGLPLPLVQLAYLRLPQLVSYGLFLLLVITPTLSAKYLPTRLRLGLDERSPSLRLLRAAAAIVVQSGFVYTWTLAAPLLVRVFWGWINATPPLGAAYYLQVQGNWIVVSAAASALARTWLVPRAYHDAAARARVRRLAAALVMADTRTAPTRRLPVSLRAVLSAAFLTLLISGFIGGLVEALAVYIFIVVLLFARSLWLPRLGSWNSWERVVTRVPVALRLVVVFLAGNLESQLIVSAFEERPLLVETASATFLPVLLGVCFGLLTAIVLLPQEGEPPLVDA